MDKKFKAIFIVLALIFVFVLVFGPHYYYRFPIHADEWRHITEALKLKNGEYTLGSNTYEVGFHLFLMILSYAFDLVLAYRYLPAIWACISALTLFYVAYRKTNNYYIGLIALLFFASIKSSANLTGIWFFTPLSFSIPFIYLYIFYFSEGIEKEKDNYIIVSLIIMSILLFVHPIAVLFSLGFIFVYCLLNIKKAIKRRSLLWFLSLPLIGICFYAVITKSASGIVIGIVELTQFKYGWGVLEANNSILDVYGLVGYFLAAIGGAIILIINIQKKEKKNLNHLLYLIWPAYLILMITLYRIIKVSYLAPFQRNLYYFALAMPFLSAIGMYYFIVWINKRLNFSQNTKVAIGVIVTVILVAATISSISMPEEIITYRVLDEADYKDLSFLSTLQKGSVMADPVIATAIYPISMHDPVATMYFYGDRETAENFFKESDCKSREKLLSESNSRYVLTRSTIDCNWTLVYNGTNILYSVDIRDRSS